jgi:hypothetical protein
MQTISEEVLEQHQVRRDDFEGRVTCSCSPNVVQEPEWVAKHIAKESVNFTIEVLTEGLRDSLNPDRMGIGSVAAWIESHRED